MNSRLRLVRIIRFVRCTVVLGAVASWGSARAVAQQPPSTRPSATAVDPKLKQMLEAGSSGAIGKPVAPAPASTVPATTRPGVSQNAPATNVLREGSLIIDRTGRIARTADGSQVEFVFDADGQAMRDAPVVILPNLTLMKMEQAAAGVNRDLRFRVTGMVTEYRGRNYVLLDKVVVVPDTAGRF